MVLACVAAAPPCGATAFSTRTARSAPAPMSSVRVDDRTRLANTN